MSRYKSTFFSVILPVYNIEAYIEKCLDSLLSQTWKDFELIIIDDGSTDNSGKICDAYADRFENCLILHTRNGGVSSARNLGLSRAGGKYITFVDGDDFVDICYLETFHRLLTEENKMDAAICGVTVGSRNIVLNNRQDKNGCWNKEELLEEMIKPDSIRGFLVNKAFRRDILFENHITFDTGIAMCEDLLFCIRFAGCCQYGIFENTPLYHYVKRQSSASQAPFNPKRITVLSAYKKILRILNESGNKNAVNTARINLFLHYIDIYLMIRKHKEYRDVRKEAGAYIKQHCQWLFIHNIHIKFRIKGFWAICLMLFESPAER